MSQSLSGPIKAGATSIGRDPLPAGTQNTTDQGSHQRRDPRDDEIASLRKHFAADDLQSTEVRCLAEEGEQLFKVLKKAFPNDTRDTWTYADLDDAVQQSRRAWESKERLGHGKPQKLFHSLMLKFNHHSNLFQFFPSQSLYASVVTGATAMLVNASVNHSKTIEELSDALDTITEAVALADIESGLIKSSAMQNAVAKLYISIFLFFGDAVRWYRSSAMSKIGHSLHKNFSERFRNQLEKITDQAANVRYVAQLGSQAEVRVARLEVEGLQDELNDVRVGMSGGLRRLAEYLHAQHGESMKQHEKTQELLANYQSAGMLPAPQVAELDYQRLIRGIRGVDGNAGLLEPPRAATPLSSYDDDQSMTFAREASPAPSISTHPTLAQQLEGLTLEGSTNDTSSPTHPNLFDRLLAQAVNNWLSVPDSSLLYLEYLSGLPTEDTILAISAQIIASSNAVDIPVVPSKPDLTSTLYDSFSDRPIQRLAVFTLWLAHQISRLDTTSPPTSSLANWNEQTPLEETTISTATSILFSTLNNVTLAAKRLHIVIPGHPFLTDIDSSQLRIFFNDLKSSMNRSDLTLKVIVLTHVRLTSILPLLEPRELALLRQQLGKHKGAKMPVLLAGLSSDL